MSAIHRIDDIWSMEAGRFFRFARRLPAYQGVMRTVAEQQAMREQRMRGGAAEVIPLTTGAQLGKVMGTSAEEGGLAGLVDYG